MALTVKKVVVTEVAVTTVKVEVTKASVLDAAGESIQCANAVTWLPDHLDIDIETGVIRNWSAPTSEQLQHSDNADDLLLDALEPSIAAQANDVAIEQESKIALVIPTYVNKHTTEKEWAAIIGGIKTNPATTTTENAQPVEVAEPVQPEVAETAPDDQQAKQVEIEPIKPVEKHQIYGVEGSDILMFGAALSQGIVPDEAFADGVALAESVLVPVEPEPVAVEPVEEDESLRRRTPAQPRYRNPDDHDQTWTGRGKQPEWLRQQIANGKNLEDFLIGANPSPVAPVTTDIEQSTTHLPTVTVSLKDGKWYAMHNDQVASSAQTAFEAVKGVLKRCGKSGVFEINRLETKCENQVFTIDDSRTANTETVYLTKQADGWIAKTPTNKNVTAAISITGELTALLSAVEGIEPANAIIAETTDDDMRTRGKRRYSIKAAQVGDAAPAHAPAVPQAQDEEPLSYAQIIALINHASMLEHLDNIKTMRVDHHADEKERHALVMRLGDKRAQLMAANAMRLNK